MAVKALKELRELIHCCLTDGIPGKHKVNKTKTRLADIHQEARDKRLKSKYVRHIDDIQQLLALVDETFREIRDYDLEKSPEIIRFLSIYLSVLDAFNETTTVSFPASSAAAAHAGKLITDGRKLLNSFRMDHLSRMDNLPGGMTLLTLYSRFETWLSETKKLSGNFCIIPKDGDMGGRNAPAFPVDKMDEDFKELIEEAAVLKKDFLAFPQSPWYPTFASAYHYVEIGPLRRASGFSPAPECAASPIPESVFRPQTARGEYPRRAPKPW